MKTLNQLEFLVLREIEKGEQIDSKIISKKLNLKETDIRNIVDTFLKEGIIDKKITDKGLKLLQPYKVKRAILIAAGSGSRMKPITINTPKPLIKVRGKKIIETLLDAIILAEIEEIIIVVGYSSESFEILLEKYPNIHFIYNSKYIEENNISSVYLVRDKMENAYVFESDIYLANPSLIEKYEYTSNYLGRYVKQTTDWCLKTKGEYIKEMVPGGRNCYLAGGIAYFDQIAGQTFKKDVEYVYNNVLESRQKLYDLIHFGVCKTHYKFKVKEFLKEDIAELDTFQELQEFDPIYKI